MRHQRKSAAAQRAAHQLPRPDGPVSPLDYVRPFDDVVTPGVRVVHFCRVSGRAQDGRGRLAVYDRVGRERIERLGGVVVATVCEVGPGWREDRPRFASAVELAIDHDATIVAYSVDRFIRPLGYDRAHQDTVPTNAEFRALVDESRGATLATLTHPETPWNEVRALQTRLGSNAGRSRGRDRTKEEVMDQVVAGGMSVREAAELLGVTKRTIYRWKA